MNQNLKESKKHGTIEDPFALYHIHNLGAPFEVSLHWHDEVEIVYIERGELFLTIEKTDYVGNAGDIFLINSQQIHRMSMENLDTSYYTILFPLSSLLFETADNVNHGFLLPLLERKQFFVSRLTHSPDYERFLSHVQAIIAAHYSTQKSRQLRIRTLLLLFICECIDSDCIKVATRPTRRSWLHHEILAFVNEHYLEELTLEVVASQFHMVPKYFSRYFQQTFHMTLTSYINHLRLEKAMELLDTTALPITEVALQSGYSSCSYFNRRFRQAFGESPLTYRRRGFADSDR